MAARRLKVMLAAGVTGLAMAGGALADVSVTGDIGTTGIGFHAGMPVAPNVNVRFGTGYLGYTFGGSTSSADYALSLKAKTMDALVDWYPVQGSAFRLTAGLALNGNKIDVNAKPNGNGQYVVGGNAYSASQVNGISGRTEFGKVAPYLGFGWGHGEKEGKGWSFSSDVGVLFQGSPRTTLDAGGCSGGAAVCSQLATDLARERAALNDEVSRFKLYPVLRVGVSYRF
ncbi:hypothetical protein SAMN06265795_101188 [Noviherbaspirillum humi]|uniref:Outer membrane protein beta-barrel domain-containing protein n=1 Tax=Noviherbaspirillum humi TaxID=1688639 RepID=A0A239C0C6_9BURK|nr:hypothetical protein [Noviherbaspirillum humi]SNS13580.1 hypothetical protein SAMN06265795_101188 [Noviherbaspirillum humi]